MKEINRLFLLMGINDSINTKNEAAKKAEKSLKEEAESKLTQLDNFEKYRRTVYKEEEE